MPSRGEGLADDVFAQYGAEGRAAVARSRKWRASRALEVDVAADAVPPDHLADKDRSAVAELRHELAKLVARIGHRQRLATRGGAIAGEYSDPLGRRQGRDVEPEVAGESFVQPDKLRRSNRRRRQTREKPLRKPGVAVVERKGGSVSRFSHHGSGKKGRWSERVIMRRLRRQVHDCR